MYLELYRSVQNNGAYSIDTDLDQRAWMASMFPAPETRSIRTRFKKIFQIHAYVHDIFDANGKELYKPPLPSGKAL